MKSILLTVALVLVVGSGMFAIYAKPRPAPLPVPSPGPVAHSEAPEPPSPLPNPQADQPTITWSVPQLSATMFPGTSSTTTVSFRSSQTLTNVAVDITPSLSGIASATPATFASIVANQDYKINLTLKAPLAFIRQDFGGTIHLRDASTPSKTFATPLPIDALVAWTSTSLKIGDSSGITLNVPATWTVLPAGSTNLIVISNVASFSPLSQQALSSEALFTVERYVNANPTGAPVSSWFNTYSAGGFGSPVDSQSTTTLDGQPAVVITTEEIGGAMRYYVVRGTDILVFSYRLAASQFIPYYQSILASVVMP